VGDRMNRRDTVFALLALGATPLAALAQQAGRVRVIGVLSAPTLSAANIEAIRQGLREQGPDFDPAARGPGDRMTDGERDAENRHVRAMRHISH